MLDDGGATEQRCPICLSDDMDDRAVPDGCLVHSFCFKCIREWAKVRATCPLCKVPFSKIVHRIRSDVDFVLFDINEGNEVNHAAQRTRISGQLTRPPQTQGSNPFVSRAVPTIGANGQHNGFYSQSAIERRGVEKRIQVYATNTRSVYVARNKYSRVRDISLEALVRNPEAIERLIPFIERDVRIMLGIEDVDLVVHYIVNLLKQMDMASVEFVNALQVLLDERAEHFVHELKAFARSPLTMAGYDAASTHLQTPCVFREGQRPSAQTDSDSESSESIMSMRRRGGETRLSPSTSGINLDASRPPVHTTQAREDVHARPVRSQAENEQRLRELAIKSVRHKRKRSRT